MSLPVAFASVILIWSTTPLAIKWSALGIGFSLAVLLRMLIGAFVRGAAAVTAGALSNTSQGVAELHG